MKEFEMIYDEFFTDVYRFIISIAKNPTVAEDVVEETFLKALENYHKLKDPTKIKSWLFRIAKNTYLTLISKNAKSISLDEIEASSGNNEELNFIRQEVVKDVRKILHKMKEPYKEVFYLRVFANLSFKEIAEVFELDESWARQIFHRAKIKIKEEIR